MEFVKDPLSTSVNENADLRKALEILTSTQVGIALIINHKYKLMGTLTDGDIRRGLLNGFNLESKVSDVMNKNYTFIYEKEVTDIAIALKKFSKKGVRHLPVLNNEGILKNLLLNYNDGSEKIMNNPVIIMAGGLGSRLRPHTDKCPKPMLKINGKPILEIIIKNCIDSGFREFFISVNYLKNIIKDYFGDGSKWGIKISYLEENEPLGTGGSLILLPKDLKNPFLVLNGDVLTKFNPSKLLEFHNKNNATATLSVREYILEVPFGVVETDGLQVTDLLEKPSYPKLVNAGVYVLNPNVISLIKNEEKLDMPELLLRVQQRSQKVIAFPIHEYWLDIGRLESLKKAFSTWDKN
ncbi:Nucleoside-diphosphate-sugar pyrophosphorylase [Prochlorococcus marinus str. MIT 9215]|uniref:Nucleoside-diphosphate-sugar pyrophosphorylase n=1 Tax=Prochlorococcus marinus (strain MIT 9215) TaxID=93060 RepID=A8G626_PROM2|nr:nucleotidyltransferase family protein [Prochlorococcus marinus]ABV51057.1 Nucleoside-diphosphate-sugar pyrophosphorylase [Prochlorococcus marinus str. MIT 9215]